MGQEERFALRLVSLIEAGVFLLFVAVAGITFFGTLDEFKLRRHLNMALDNYLTGNIADTEYELGRCVESKPDYPDSYRMLFALQLRRESLKSAEETLESLEEFVGKESSAYAVCKAVFMVEEARRAGKLHSVLPEALELLRKAKRLEPELSDIELSIAILSYLKGDTKEVNSALQRALEKKRFSRTALPHLYNLEGTLKTAEGKYKEALKEFEKVLELDKKFELARTNIGLSALQGILLSKDTGQVRELLGLGRSSLARLSSSQKQLTTLIRNAIGVGYARLGDFREATQFFESAGDPLSRFNLGILRTKMSFQGGLGAPRHRKKAIEFLLPLREDLTAEQKLQRALALASCYYGEGDSDSAIRFAKEAIALKPRSAFLHRLCGAIAYKSGQYGVARESFKNSLDLKPDQPQLMTLYQSLLQAPIIAPLGFYVPSRKGEELIWKPVGTIEGKRGYVCLPQPVLRLKVKTPSTSRPIEKSNISAEVVSAGSTASSALAFDSDDTVIVIPPTLADGEWLFRITVRDWAENSSILNLKTVVDTARPTIVKSAYKDGETIPIGKPLIFFKLADDRSGLDFSTLSLSLSARVQADIVDRTIIQEGKWLIDGESAQKGQKVGEFFSFRVPIELRGGDRLRLTLRVSDRAGNTLLAGYNLKVK